MSFYRRVKGFTLVEIMIVVAIIGIIISIAVPAFLRARENSRGRACQENLSKLDGATEQYALEFKLTNGTYVPNSALLTPPGSTAAGSGFLKSMPKCPSNGTYRDSIGPGFTTVGEQPLCSIGSNTGVFERHEIQ